MVTLKKLSEIFLKHLHHLTTFGILNQPRGIIKIFRRKHIKKLSLFGQSIIAIF